MSHLLQGLCCLLLLLLHLSPHLSPHLPLRLRHLCSGVLFCCLEGLCHISELALERVRNIEKFIEVGDSFDVKVLAVDDDSKKLSLSRKAAIIDKQG